MKLDDEDSGTGLNIVPESHGMDVPSACTIVIIAGKQPHKGITSSTDEFPSYSR